MFSLKSTHFFHSFFPSKVLDLVQKVQSGQEKHCYQEKTNEDSIFKMQVKGSWVAQSPISDS